MFFKRKEDREMDELKKTVNAPLEPHEEFVPLAPAISERQVPQSAPLFVKVEKYSEMLVRLNEMRSYTSSMRKLFNVMYEMEVLRNESIKIMRATLQRLEKDLVEIDTELVRPRGFDIPMYSSPDAHNIEGSLDDLQRQLGDLRRELQEMK